MMRSLLISALLCISVSVFAQVKISGGFDRDSVLIGDPVSYTLTIKKGPGIKIKKVYSSAIDSIISAVQTQRQAETDTSEVPKPVISDYTITNYGKWKDQNADGEFEGAELAFDTTQVGGETILENTFKLSFWDPGPQILRHAAMDFVFGDSIYQYPYSGQAQIFVTPPFDMAELESDSIDIAPIKPIIKEERNITDFYFLFAFLGILLILGLLWLLTNRLKRKKSEAVEEVIEVKRPAHEIALDRLNGLQNTQLWQTGEIKEYQSQLTYTIREYLENRYDIQALESTTDEIVKSLRTIDFDADDETSLKEILQVADLVKFAKATPDSSIHERFLNKAFDFVKRTKQEITLNEAEE